MSYKLRFTTEARSALASLEGAATEAKLRKVNKALGFLQTDPKYPSLSSHKYASLKGPNGEEVWDSYVENNSPSAWRIFWHYGPESGEITVVAITPHP